MAPRVSTGPVNMMAPQDQAVIAAEFVPTETDNASETEAYRQFPANFMVFTSGQKTSQDLRSGSVYKCFAHVSTTPAGPFDSVRPRLLGVASDTMPWNALQKTRRVGVTVRGAVTVAVNKDELAACQIGDLLEYKYDPTPVQWMGLSSGFRTARISRHISQKPIFNPGMGIAHFKEQIMMRGGPKQFAQFVLSACRGRAAGVLPVDRLYGVGRNTLMRVAPPPDSMDWVRDCLGVDFDGPTAWDRYMNLHKWYAGETKVGINVYGAPRRGYRGWLLDFVSKNNPEKVSSKNLSAGLGANPTNQDIFNDGDMKTVYDDWNNTDNEFCLFECRITANELANTGTPKLQELTSTIFGSKATNHLAYILESAVCDGNCGILGRLIEKGPNSDEAVVDLAGPHIHEE